MLMVLTTEVSLTTPPSNNHHVLFKHPIPREKMVKQNRVFKAQPTKDGRNAKQRRKDAKRAASLASGEHTFSLSHTVEQGILPALPMMALADEPRSGTRPGSTGYAEKSALPPISAVGGFSTENGPNTWLSERNPLWDQDRGRAGPFLRGPITDRSTPHRTKDGFSPQKRGKEGGGAAWYCCGGRGVG